MCRWAPLYQVELYILFYIYIRICIDRCLWAAWRGVKLHLIPLSIKSSMIPVNMWYVIRWCMLDLAQSLSQLLLWISTSLVLGHSKGQEVLASHPDDTPRKVPQPRWKTRSPRLHDCSIVEVEGSIVAKLHGDMDDPPITTPQFILLNWALSVWCLISINVFQQIITTTYFGLQPYWKLKFQVSAQNKVFQVLSHLR